MNDSLQFITSLMSIGTYMLANDVYGVCMFNPSGGRNAYPNPAYGEIGSECN